jgi:hypothetical protein
MTCSHILQKLYKSATSDCPGMRSNSHRILLNSRSYFVSLTIWTAIRSLIKNTFCASLSCLLNALQVVDTGGIPSNTFLRITKKKLMRIFTLTGSHVRLFNKSKQNYLTQSRVLTCKTCCTYTYRGHHARKT